MLRYRASTPLVKEFPLVVTSSSSATSEYCYGNLSMLNPFVKKKKKTEYRSASDPEGPCALSPHSPARSRRQRSGSERQAALRETQAGGSPILSLHHTSHLFSRLAGA